MLCLLEDDNLRVEIKTYFELLDHFWQLRFTGLQSFGAHLLLKLYMSKVIFLVYFSLTLLIKIAKFAKSISRKEKLLHQNV